VRSTLQDQLLKAGLVDEKSIKNANKGKLKEQRQSGKKGKQPSSSRLQAEQKLKENSERDRALAEQRNAEQRSRELSAQVAQLVDHYRQPRGGDIAYNFADGSIIKRIYVSEKHQRQLTRGQLVIVRDADSYALVPVAAAERIKARLPDQIVVWNAPPKDEPDEDDPYKDFPIPDDLMW